VDTRDAVPTTEPSIPQGRPDSHHVAWRGLLTLHAVVTKQIAAELDASGTLSYADYDVLVTLNESPGQRLRLSELAELTLFSHSGISRAVTRLEGEKLLRREKCETDGRGFYATLTKAGRQALLDTWPRYRELIEEKFASQLSAGEAEIMGALMHRVIVSLGNHSFHHVFPSRLTDAPV